MLYNIKTGELYPARLLPFNPVLLCSGDAARKGASPLFRYVVYDLVFVEVHALEVNSGETFAALLEILTDGELAVLDKFLLHESRLFEELVQTSLSDVLNHLLGKVGSLGGSCLGSNLAAFLSLFLGEPSLAMLLSM